jgi:hypothetical protein
MRPAAIDCQLKDREVNATCINQINPSMRIVIKAIALTLACKHSILLTILTSETVLMLMMNMEIPTSTGIPLKYGDKRHD